MIKVLLVEDNKEISENIVRYFKNDVDIVPTYNGEDALDLLALYTYDIVILDLMLPEVDGMSILNYIVNKYLNTGVIILTAKEDLEDKLKAFDI
ncbi:MAG: response regulator [Paraclostridium sp.]